MATLHINRRTVHTDATELTGEAILGLAGIGPDHDLFLLQGEGDRTGGTPVGLSAPFAIHSGQHFRAIPSNRNFG